MPNENTFYRDRVPVAVWGTGNMGRAAIRSVAAHPGLELTAVIVRDPDKVGRDAGTLAGLGRDLGVVATADVEAALATLSGAQRGAVAYMASGDIRPDDALADVTRALHEGAHVVTPAIYALYDPRNAPAALLELVRQACAAGGASLFVNGIDPGWGNDILPVLVSGLAGTIDVVRCQELFDYSTYDVPDAVRYSVGMGQPMDYQPLMVAPGVPTMIWGGQIRMIARGLGVEVDEITETLERRALDSDVTNAMGLFESGTQGALRFEVRGLVHGEVRIVMEHVTRITPDIAPEWARPEAGSDGAHRVIIEGRPHLEITIEASDEFVDGVGSRAAGGNATAANRLVNAIPWLDQAPPGVYDALDVPLSPAIGRVGLSIAEKVSP